MIAFKYMSFCDQLETGREPLLAFQKAGWVSEIWTAVSSVKYMSYMASVAHVSICGSDLNAFRFNFFLTLETA